MRKIIFLVLLITVFEASSVPSDQEDIRNVLFKKMGEIEIKTVNGTLVKTFYYSKFLKPIWATALVICKSYGMNLFSIDSKKEETLVLDLAAEIAGVSFHIGLINAGTIDTWYSTKTGKTVDFTLNWLSGQPNADGPKHRCTCIHPEGALKKITQSDCNNLFSFICEDYHFKENCAPKDL